MRRAVQREKGEQAGGVKLLVSLGFRVYNAGTRRAKPPKGIELRTKEERSRWFGTRQTPGIPDVEAFSPVRGGRRQVWKWEAKADARGQLSPAQAEYRELCRETNAIVHVSGDVDALIAALITHGFLRPDQVGHYRQPTGAAR